MLVARVWLQQQKQIYRLRNMRAGYVLYRALVIKELEIHGGFGSTWGQFFHGHAEWVETRDLT